MVVHFEEHPPTDRTHTCVANRCVVAFEMRHPRRRRHGRCEKGSWEMRQTHLVTKSEALQMPIFRNRFGESGRRNQFDETFRAREKEHRRCAQKNEGNEAGGSDKIKFRAQQKSPLIEQIQTQRPRSGCQSKRKVSTDVREGRT